MWKHQALKFWTGPLERDGSGAWVNACFKLWACMCCVLAKLKPSSSTMLGKQKQVFKNTMWALHNYVCRISIITPNLVLMYWSSSMSRFVAKYVYLHCGTVQVVVSLAMLGISIGSWASASFSLLWNEISIPCLLAADYGVFMRQEGSMDRGRLVLWLLDRDQCWDSFCPEQRTKSVFHALFYGNGGRWDFSWCRANVHHVSYNDTWQNVKWQN